MLKKLVNIKNLGFLLLNFGILIFQLFLIGFFYNEIHKEIPIFFTRNWGLEVLGDKINIFLIPSVSLVITAFSIWILAYSENFYQYLFKKILTYFVSILNLILTFSLMDLIKKTTFSNLFFLDYIGSELLNSFFISFFIAVITTPYFIRAYEKFGLITDPKKHHHPGMILKNPSARGGGLIFAFAFTITTLVTVKINPIVISLIFATLLAAFIGILDDISNTNPNKKYKILGNPIFRLFVMLPIPVLILMFNGVLVNSITNPLGGIIDLSFYTLNINGISFPYLIYFLTFVWILWLINLLSWSNGVDGQYSGIISVAGITISLLALRFTNISEENLNISKLAIITSGAAIGLAPYTWNPSKLMWGFGATSAGIVIAALSIIASTKISISVLVLLVPFMDGVITIIRRLVNKQNPFKGDRGHLHHLLLQRGWSIKQVAVFYWITTGILGTIGYLSSDRDLPLLVLTLGGIVGFFITLLNLNLKFNKN